MLGTTFTHPCIEGVKRLILNYQEKVRTATEKTNKELRDVAKNYKTTLRRGLDNFEEEPLIDINLSNISFELDALSKKQEALKATQKNEAVENFLKFKQDLLEELSIPESTQRQTPHTIINQIPEILNILVARYTMEIMQIESKKKEDLENVIEEYKKAMESFLQKIGNESPGSTKLSEPTNFLENISERQKEIESSSQKQVDEKICKFKEEIINEILRQDITQMEEETVAMEEETVATERERVAMEEETVATEEETCELDTENMPSIFIDDDGNIKESGQELKLLNDKFVFRENDDDLDFVGIKNEDRVEFQDELPEELLNLLGLNGDEEADEIGIWNLEEGNPYVQKQFPILFHTKGNNYDDDWIPMTPMTGQPERIKWNGQFHHRDDHLLIEHEQRRQRGTEEFGIVLSRDKQGIPYTLAAVFSGITKETQNTIGTADRFILNIVNIQTILGHNIGDKLNLVPQIDGYKWRNSALHQLGLKRIKGGLISGIQLCEKI